MKESNSMLKTWIGKSKSDCLEYCRVNHLQIIHFAHWLSIPEEQLVLSFKHQNCIEAIQNGLKPTNVY